MGIPAALTVQEQQLLDDYSPALKEVGLSGKLSDIIASLTADPGRCDVNVLWLANDVANAQTVTIGTDVYEVNVVTTDTTANASGGQLNNITGPATVTITAHGLTVGRLIRVQSEIMQVIGVVDVDTVIVSRGYSGTTVATHADGQDIFKAAAGVTSGRKAVGLGTAVTSTAFGAALAATINAIGGEPVAATVISNNEVLLVATTPGAFALACTETLAGANNVWAASTMYGGRAAGQRRFSVQVRVPTATEVSLGTLHFAFDFAPTLLAMIVAPTATPGAVKICTNSVAVAGNVLTLTNAGGVDWAATDNVVVVVSD